MLIWSSLLLVCLIIKNSIDCGVGADTVCVAPTDAKSLSSVLDLQESVLGICDDMIAEVNLQDVDSTQRYAIRNFVDLCAEHKLSGDRWVRISAAQQSEGIGTTDTTTHKERVWFSPPGNVYVTYMIPWPRSRQSQLIHFAQIGTFALRRTLEEVAGIQSSIKWVNDVLVKDKKIAGVLATRPNLSIPSTESAQIEEEELVLVGIGVNVQRCPGVEELQDAPLTDGITCIQRESTKSPPIMPDDILKSLTWHLYAAVQKLKTEGFASEIHEELDAFLAWRGERIEVDFDGSAQTGWVMGLGEDGSLRFRPDNSAEVSPLFSGRIRKIRT